MVDLPTTPKKRPIPERPVLIQSGDNCLEGLFISKNSESLPVLLNSAHPQMGGSMDHALLNEIAHLLGRQEVSSLRYNYRGVGASQGQYAGGDGEEDDMAAATEFLVESVYGDEGGALVCAGYSFGSWIGMRRAAKDTRLKRLLLIAPPLARYDFSLLPKLQARVGILTGGRDPLCLPDDLKAFLATLQKKNPDWSLPEVYAIPEATHYFVRGLPEAGRVAAGFLTTGRFTNAREET